MGHRLFSRAAALLALPLAMMLIPGPSRADDPEGMIKTGPSPAIIPRGQKTVKRAIRWSSGGKGGAKLWVQVDEEKEKVFSDDHEGKKDIELSPNRIYTFKLYNRAKSKVFATATLKAIREKDLKEKLEPEKEPEPEKVEPEKEPEEPKKDP
jgi:hypothetical protein